MNLRTLLTTACLVCAAELAPAQLIVGTNSGSPVHHINVNTGVATPIFSGVGVYGLAADDTGQKIYITEDQLLFSWDYNSPNPPVQIGMITDGFGAGIRIDGLAWANGALYCSVQFPSMNVPKGIYRIDLATTALVQPPLHVFPNQASAVGGLGFNPNDGLFYLLDDQVLAGMNGIYSVDAFGSGATVHITNSPPFYSDVDGFDVGGGKCYLMRDIPTTTNHSAIAVYNLATNMYEATIPTPETMTGGFGSGAAWAPSLFGGTPIGNNYCGPAVANSSGFGATIRAFGSTQVAMNDVTLTAEMLPAGQFGYFLAGQTQGFFNPPNSSGFICLSGTIGRYNQAQNIIQGPTGTITLNLGAIPVSPPAPVLPGQTWNFQCWFRDNNPTLTSNFTDGISIMFQ